MRLGSATIALVGGVVFGWPMPSAGQQMPTYTKHVAPILFKHCSQCHRPNEVAPMSLMTYEQVRPWARSIKSKVDKPYWQAGWLKQHDRPT